jgi:hypothetical protein
MTNFALEADEGFVRINLAEALRRVKYNNEQSKKKALHALAAAEVSIFSRMGNPKFCLIQREEPTIEDYGYEAYNDLPAVVLKFDASRILSGQSVPKNSLSTMIDNYVFANGDKEEVWGAAYDRLTKAIWVVERNDHSNPGEKYFALIGEFRKRLAA